jgi:hypothetical protein
MKQPKKNVLINENLHTMIKIRAAQTNTTIEKYIAKCVLLEHGLQKTSS